MSKDDKFKQQDSATNTGNSRKVASSTDKLTASTSLLTPVTNTPQQKQPLAVKERILGHPI